MMCIFEIALSSLLTVPEIALKGHLMVPGIALRANMFSVRGELKI